MTTVGTFYCFYADNSAAEEDEDDAFTERDTSGGEDGEEEALPVYLWKPSDTTDVLGEWEVHTKVRYKLVVCFLFPRN